MQNNRKLINIFCINNFMQLVQLNIFYAINKISLSITSITILNRITDSSRVHQLIAYVHMTEVYDTMYEKREARTSVYEWRCTFRVVRSGKEPASGDALVHTKPVYSGQHVGIRRIPKNFEPQLPTIVAKFSVLLVKLSVTVYRSSYYPELDVKYCTETSYEWICQE